MAKTKAAGTTKLGRDSIGKRLGIKLFAGQKAVPGSIIVRQRGTQILPGKNVRRGKDDTLYSAKEGIIRFRKTKKVSFDGSKKLIKIVEVVSKK